MSYDEKFKNKEVYVEIFNYALENEYIYNIAITGIYGSGKTIILNTYLKEREKKDVITIQLGKYNENNSDVKSQKYKYVFTEKVMPEYSKKLAVDYDNEISSNEESLIGKIEENKVINYNEYFAGSKIKFNTAINAILRYGSNDKYYNYKFATGNTYIKTHVEKKDDGIYLVSYLLDAYSNPKDVFNSGIKDSEFGIGVPYMLKIKLRESKLDMNEINSK